MDNFKTPKYRLKIVGVCPKYLSWMIVRGNYQSLWADLDITAFGFCRDRIMITPNFQKIGKFIMVFAHIIKENRVFSVVSVPPFIHGLDE